MATLWCKKKTIKLSFKKNKLLQQHIDSSCIIIVFIVIKHNLTHVSLYIIVDCLHLPMKNVCYDFKHKHEINTL